MLLRDLLNNAVGGLSTMVLPRLLSILPCCAYISLYAIVCAPTLWLTRVLRARWNRKRCNWCRGHWEWMEVRHSSRSPPGVDGLGQSSTAVGWPSSESFWFSPFFSCVLWNWLGCGLWCIQDWGLIWLTPKYTFGHWRSESVSGPPDSSGCH